MNAQVLEVIRNSAAVPSVPQVVSRVLQLMQDPEFDYEDLVRAVSTDAGMASELLRLSNSALFAVRNKIVSLRQALTLLGPRRTRSILLGRYLVDSLSTHRVPGVDTAYFWRRSVACGVVAAHFARAITPKLREEAFICGLLADVGIVVLAQAIPEAYGQFVRRFAPHEAPFTPESEFEIVGATHGEVSAMVLNHWGLPEPVTRAVNRHQSPSGGSSESDLLAALVFAADIVARLLCEIPDLEQVPAAFSSAAEAVGTDVATLVDLLLDVERDIDELAGILRIAVIKSGVYSLIAKTIHDHLSQFAPSA
jgi:HD-like signal output (HDOD) protein